MTFRIRSLSMLLLLGGAMAVASAQVRRPSPEIINWIPSRYSPSKLAQSIDSRLSSLRNVEVETRFAVSLPKRQGTGAYTMKSRIQTGKVFAIEFPEFAFPVPDVKGKDDNKDVLTKIRLDSDGVRARRWDLSESEQHRTLRARIAISKNANAEAWALRHPELIYGGILGERPFSKFVTLAARSGSGLTVKTEERTYRRLNIAYPQFRLVIERTAAAAKRLGTLRVEVIADGKLFLPINVVASSNLKNHEPANLRSSYRWKQHRGAWPNNEFALGDAPKKKRA